MGPIRVTFLPTAAVGYLVFAAVFAAVAGAPLWAPGQRAFLGLNLLVAVLVGVLGGYLRQPGGDGGWGGGRIVRRPPQGPRSAVRSRRSRRTPLRRPPR